MEKVQSLFLEKHLNRKPIKKLVFSVCVCVGMIVENVCQRSHNVLPVGMYNMLREIQRSVEILYSVAL